MRIKLNDLLLIGSDPLNTTAQKLTGAINELDAEIAALGLPDAWHKYNGSVEVITLNSSSSNQTVTFHDTLAGGAYHPWVDSPTNKVLKFIGDPVYTETDSVNHKGTLSYTFKVSENNTKFYLRELH